MTTTLTTRIHEKVPGFIPEASCCAELPGGVRCPWHADALHDTDSDGLPAVRRAAMAHALTGHRVVFDDETATTEIRVTS